jgi:dipeptide/tripeptide permease
MNYEVKASDEAITAAPAKPKVPSSHPPGFYFIFWGEFAERCSYYGMRAIMPLYLTGVLAFADARASQVYFLFKMSAYLLPLLGGFLADRYFGKYWTIVGFSLPYVLGHFILGIQTPAALFVAMVLLACGSGVIKPNISTLMGMTYDQKRPGQEGLRTAAFLWFYFSINVGSLISLYALPEIRDHFAHAKNEQPLMTTSTMGLLASPLGQGPLLASSLLMPKRPVYGPLPWAYRMAFQFPAWLMVAALLVFAAGKRHYAVEVIERKRKTPEERRQQWEVLATLFGVFMLMVFFWFAYEQNDSLWTFFARDHMNRVVDLGFFRKEFAPDGFQFINAGLIILLVPFFGWMWRRVDPHGRRFPPATKIFMGFLFTVAAFGLMALAGFAATGAQKVSAWWIIFGFTLVTLGEIFVYGTGLELAYAAAPANMKSFITACFLLTIAGGDFLNIWIGPWYESKMAPGPFFAMTAGVVLAASVAFYFVGRRLTRVTYARRAEASPG